MGKGVLCPFDGFVCMLVIGLGVVKEHLCVLSQPHLRESTAQTHFYNRRSHTVEIGGF